MKRAFDISGLMRSALMAVLSLLLSALVTPGFVAPERITEFHLAALDLPADLTAEPTRPEGLRAIRAPPASL